MLGGTHNMPRVSGAEREARNHARNGSAFRENERPPENPGMGDRMTPPAGGRESKGGDFRQPGDRFPEQRPLPEPLPPQELKPRRERKIFRKKSGCCLFTLIGTIAVIAGIIAYL